jgi:hypothetical protein
VVVVQFDTSDVLAIKTCFIGYRSDYMARRNAMRATDLDPKSICSSGWSHLLKIAPIARRTVASFTTISTIPTIITTSTVSTVSTVITTAAAAIFTTTTISTATAFLISGRPAIAILLNRLSFLLF